MSSRFTSGDAVETALSYQNDGAQMLHIVDLDGAFSDPNSEIRAVFREIVSQTRPAHPVWRGHAHASGRGTGD